MSLRARIEAAAKANGGALNHMTVLAVINDPYRLDTPAHRRDGEWVAEQIERLGIRTPVHLRGLHYRLVAVGDVVRPNGLPYVNDDPSWTWLSQTATKAARWLGYVAWSDIIDERNEPPTLVFAEGTRSPAAFAGFDFRVELPRDIEPYVDVSPARVRQPYALYFIGEKSSLAEILSPIAQRYGASVAYPTGESSMTMIHAMAAHAAADGRPAVVFYFSDFDPSGLQMPISVARRLQAHRDLEFPDLNIQVQQVALNVEQVRAHGLPSTPLKESERRASKWKDAFGVEQTEIDALIALRPDLLRSLAARAIAPYYDRTLDARCRQATEEYRERVEAAFASSVDKDAIADLRRRGEELVAEMQRAVDALREDMASHVPLDLAVVPVELPEPEVDGKPCADVVYDSRWDWDEATRRLRDRKAYVDGDDR
jgi:hypothetical protein